MAEFKYEITERLGVLPSRSNGWEVQLNMISWNDGEPKHDIRLWSPDGSKMGKGIALANDELKELKELLSEIEL